MTPIESTRLHTARPPRRRHTLGRLGRLGLLGCLCLLVGGAPVLAAGGPGSAPRDPRRDGAITDELPAAVARIFPGLVRIRVVMESPGPGRIVRQQGAGSGIVISREGYVITNHHVAGNASYLVCDLPGHRDLPARLVGTDPLADIAVVQIDLEAAELDPEDLVVAPWGDSDKLGIGTEVFAMGSPAAISQSVTRGIIANPRMVGGIGSMPRLDGEDVGSIVRWLVHDATIFGGNSGGPLVNARGEIIGINEIGFANLAGAIPGNLARRVAEEIISHGEVERSYLGIAVQPRLDSTPAERGALIASVTEYSPAAKAGIEVGDVLFEIGGFPIDCAEAEDLPLTNGTLFSLPVGEPLTAHLSRDGSPVELTVTSEVRGKARAPVNELRAWGITFSDPTRALRFENDVPDQPGAILLGLRQGGPAESATPPLAPGDLVIEVAGTPVTDAKSFAHAVEAAIEEEGKTAAVLLRVLRGSDDLIVLVEGRAEEERSYSARVRRPVLPISLQPVTKDLASALGLPDGTTGMRITAVREVPAEETSDLAVGDIITSAAGKPVRPKNRKDQRALQRILDRMKSGETIELAIFREGAAHETTATLIEPPETPDLADRTEIEELGFSVRGLVGAEGSHPLAEAGAVVIEEVERGGWADIARLRAGDMIVEVDRTPTPSVEAFEKFVESRVALRPAAIVFLVLRDSESRYLVVEPTWRPQ